ncbi:Calcium/calmodulin-dependent protein kinase type IV [Durusdinium trenchii]|uniref:Calcium/calmodulin-dependent protein kinase type IV n=2 Tax=Durusdinium trenchii TaxID=1381693 RepID=A0ABP0HV44_9DINO
MILRRSWATRSAFRCAMVYGLMIHSVDSSQTLHFSIFFTPEGNNAYKKTRQQTIMRRILEEHLFQMHSGDQHTTVKSKASSSLDDADWLFRFTDSKPAAFKAQAGFDYTEGILRLQASTLFEYPKLVVWKHVDKVVYTLICEPLDNPLLASNFLTLFVHELSDHFRKAGNMVEEVSSRPDEIFTILNLMLPGGQLLFTNSNLHRHFKAQISQVLSQK